MGLKKSVAKKFSLLYYNGVEGTVGANRALKGSFACVECELSLKVYPRLVWAVFLHLEFTLCSETLEDIAQYGCHLVRRT